MVIGITGTLGSGKGTVVHYLVEKYGFTHYSARSFLVRELEEAGLPVTRDTMLMIANKLRKEHHPGWIAEHLYEEARGKGNAVIESIRTVGEIDAIERHGNFILFAVDADPHTRYERIVARKSVTDRVSFEKFMADEREESTSPHAHMSNVRSAMAHADFTFNNDGTPEELFRQVDAVMRTLTS